MPVSNPPHSMNLSSSVCRHHSPPSSPENLVSNFKGFTLSSYPINPILTKKNIGYDIIRKSRPSVHSNSIIVSSYGGDKKAYDATSDSSPVKKLRQLLDSPGIHQGPACFNALSAKLVERAGFQFCFTTGTFLVIVCKLSIQASC